MNHFFYFTGYSDDVVLAGSSKRTLDEYYKTFYMLNNGVQVRAEHGPKDDPDHPGWKITCDHPTATRIPAVGEDVKHSDERIPDWLDAPGYCDVLIVESDEPLEILMSGARLMQPLTPLRLVAAKIAKTLNEDRDEDEGIPIDDIESALKKYFPPLIMNCQKCWMAPVFEKGGE